MVQSENKWYKGVIIKRCKTFIFKRKTAKAPFSKPTPKVEVAGFEPAAFWSRTKRATKLRYTSVYKKWSQ